MLSIVGGILILGGFGGGAVFGFFALQTYNAGLAVKRAEAERKKNASTVGKDWAGKMGYARRDTDEVPKKQKEPSNHGLWAGLCAGVGVIGIVLLLL